jgi:predicted RNA binding protein YcfA (HicA-like mRNA interferase family)
MKVKEVIALLRKDGWVLKTQKGSHKQFVYPTKLNKVTVPDHDGDIPKGTLNSILKQAGLKYPPVQPNKACI